MATNEAAAAAGTLDREGRSAAVAIEIITACASAATTQSEGIVIDRVCSAGFVCCKSVKVCSQHRHNPPTGPVERVPSNCGDHGDQVYLVPSNFCDWLPFCRRGLREAYTASHTSLLDLREGKRSGEGNG